jgi:hypothetical protein
MLHGPVIPLDYAIPDDFTPAQRPALVAEVRGDGLIIHLSPIGPRRAGLPYVAAWLGVVLAAPPVVALLYLYVQGMPLRAAALTIPLLAALATVLMGMVFSRCDLAARRFEFRVNPRQLRLLSSGPAGRWAQCWPREAIGYLRIEPAHASGLMHLVLTLRSGAPVSLLAGAHPDDLMQLTQILNKMLRLEGLAQRHR